jgi:hypothetical protein
MLEDRCLLRIMTFRHDAILAHEASQHAHEIAYAVSDDG